MVDHRNRVNISVFNGLQPCTQTEFCFETLFGCLLRALTRARTRASSELQ